jgi:hypothetical protein
LKYKCDECEFWGPNTLTMEVHVKKNHCEHIKCRLCDFEANTKDILETHLATCERYACFICPNKFNTVAEIKEHINAEHDGRNTNIIHAKLKRKYPEYSYEKSYYSNKIFIKKWKSN